MAFADPDALVEGLLYDLAVKDEIIVSLTADRDAYRTLAQVTLHAHAELTARYDRLHLRNRELVAIERQAVRFPRETAA